MVNRYTFQINGVLEKLTPYNKEEAQFKDIINNIPQSCQRVSRDSGKPMTPNMINIKL